MDEYIVEGEGVPDNVLLSELSEDALFGNVTLRYEVDRIYTFTGEVCISMNPFRRIPGLEDTPEHMSKYVGRYPYENPPHPYSVGDTAYQNMLNTKKNQAILISGESGAGKTEAAKTVLRYISFATPTSKAKDMEKIKDQLLDSNPILEAFGNAKTIRNDNSSRFGKYMRIQCNQAGAPVGGVINVYLLEKSRVVTRAVDERSFHIFYNILAGATDSELSKWKLTRSHDQYRYLSLSECYTVDTINDKTDYHAVLAAMKTLEFDSTIKDGVFQVCAAILHLGNITFGGGEKSQVASDSKASLKTTAELLCVKEEALEKALTMRTVSAGGRSVLTPLSEKDAAYARDAFAKSLYEKCFLRIVFDINRVIENTKLSPKEEVDIGLLDIYGFEVFETNSFEQLMINYTNEKLQQVFIELTLKAEQEEYQREGIEWTPIEYFNNRVICELIEGKPKGIIAFMDESCLLGRTTDKGFLDKLSQNFGKHAHYQDTNTSRDKSIGFNCFRLKHYAGDVVYSVVGMLDKNSDQLFRDLIGLAIGSTDKVIASLFDPAQLDTKKRPVTAGTQFRSSVQALIAMLMACEPHYIRCIKPNDQKAANMINEERTRHQIRYLGLVENLRVRRAGFAFRSPFSRFIRRYKMTSSVTWPNFKGAGGEKGGVEALLKEHGVTSANQRLGKTKVFLKDPMDLFKFEDLRKAALPPIITRLDGQWRAYLVRRIYSRMRASLIIGKHCRAWLARVRFARSQATAVIQRYARAWAAKKYYAENKQELLERKSANTIGRFMLQGLQRRFFLNQVYAPFCGVASEARLGSDTPWPQNVSFLYAPALRYLRIMYEHWRAKRMVQRLGTTAEAEVRAKVRALDVFLGKKPWDPAFPLLSGRNNYVDLDTPQRGGLLNANLPTFMLPDPTVLFALDANKVNSKSKVDPRVIIVTATQLVRVNGKKLKLAKYPPVPLAKLTEIHMSRAADQVVVLKFEAPLRDLVLDLGVATAAQAADRLQHFVMFLLSHCKESGWGEPDVVFADRIDYNNSRTDQKPVTPNGSLSFGPEPAGAPAPLVWPAVAVAKGPAHQNAVHVTAATVPHLAYPGSSTWQPRDLSFLKRGDSARNLGKSASMRRRKVKTPRGGGKTPQGGASAASTPGGAVEVARPATSPPAAGAKPKRVCEVCHVNKAKVKAKLADGNAVLMCFECKEKST